jgi:hypothetical protein
LLRKCALVGQIDVESTLQARVKIAMTWFPHQLIIQSLKGGTFRGISGKRLKAAISHDHWQDSRCRDDAASELRRGADKTDPRVDDIVAKMIGIDSHNHIDVTLNERAK